jgi:hypothetical protein
MKGFVMRLYSELHPTPAAVLAAISGVAVCAAAIALLMSNAPAESTRSGGTPEASPSFSTGVGARASASSLNPDQLPLYFEANQGQADPSVEFLNRGSSYSLHLKRSKVLLALGSSLVGMSFPGARPQAEISGLDKLPGLSNYLIGNDRELWVTGIPHYERACYKDLYPGIDLVFYGRDGHLEFDFEVDPGADPGVIRLAFQGVEGLSLDAAGNLSLDLPSGDPQDATSADGMVLRAPVVYQEVDGEKQVVTGYFALTDDAVVRFTIDNYDSSRPLVIDPVLDFSTYFGGNADERSGGIALDEHGNIYVAGYTRAADFPTLNAVQPTFGGSSCSFSRCANIFVARFDPTGHNLLYCTYLGGDGSAWARDIAVDPSGNAYIMGDLDTSNFPTVNAVQASLSGFADAFAVKLNRSGSSIVYATYLGGSDHENGNGIAADMAGNAYIVGKTSSSNFPTQNAFQGSYGGGMDDAFVAKLSSTGDSFAFSTLLGGEEDEGAEGVFVDDRGRTYVVGKTWSTGFPTVNAYQGTNVVSDDDAFVTMLQSSGTTARFSTFLGGSGFDYGRAVAVDVAGSVYVVGSTSSSDFPTINALQGARALESDMFLAKLNAAGSALVYSTYLGGSGTDIPYGIAVDPRGNAHIVGSTTSADFPTVDPIEPSDGIIRDALVVQMNSRGDALFHSSHLSGSNGRDIARGVAVDQHGAAYIIGETASSDFPTKNAFMATNPGQSETPFVMKLAWPMDFWLAAAEPPADQKAGRNDGVDY